MIHFVCVISIECECLWHKTGHNTILSYSFFFVIIYEIIFFCSLCFMIILTIPHVICMWAHQITCVHCREWVRSINKSCNDRNRTNRGITAIIYKYKHKCFYYCWFLSIYLIFNDIIDTCTSISEHNFCIIFYCYKFSDTKQNIKEEILDIRNMWKFPQKILNIENIVQ